MYISSLFCDLLAGFRNGFIYLYCLFVARCPEKTTIYLFSILVGCLVSQGLNGHMAHCLSPYPTVSGEGKKEKRNDRLEKKYPDNPNWHLLQVQ